jgi:conjugative relaxase-like TrwC/TraI family protein
MMTMSGALGAAGAVSYFKEEFEHARGSYYTEEGKTVDRWRGELAEHFGLSGEVKREDFERLCEGQDPRDGEQLVRLVRPHESRNLYGDEIETGGHRAGCDITFSAPKSVSLAALVGGDERIQEAHAEAVTAALREVERYAQARLGGSAKAEPTGKLLFASFEHDASRPDKRDGYAAPDLHTHNFAFNLTLTAEGKIKPVQPVELYRSQKYGTVVYRAVLAEKLEKLGYEIEVDRRTGAPEIRGISREYIEAASPRQREIKEAAEALNLTSTRGAAARNRRTKTYDREEMRARHQELDRQFGGQAHAVVREARAREMRTLLWDEAGSRARAQEAVTFAIEKASEREAVNDTRRLLTDALRRHLGRTTFEAVSQEMRGREERGQLARIVLDDAARERVATEKTLRREAENVERVRAGKGTQQPLTERVPEAVTTSRDVTLNESQRTAFEQIVTSRDQIIGLQGKAGTGKTTTLAAVREAAVRAGYDVQGFAPTTRAAQLLADSGMETRTLQKFLRQKDEPEALRRFLVLDESSLASTKQVNDFLSRVRPEDRVLLVGDVRQHEGVEAGSPFAQLQRHGMETARLEQIVRQKEKPLREVVENLSAGKVKEAVNGLREQGRVTEIADPGERLKTIARDYCARPDRDGTLVISPANKERVELNRMIHRELQATGQISAKNYKTKVLENRSELTGAERTFAGAYQQDDVIRYSAGSRKHGIGAGEYARVLAADEKSNTLTVRMENDRRQLSYDPSRLQGVTVYREAEREFSEGDRVQFRAPYQRERVAGGELGTLEKVEKGRLIVALDSGRSAEFHIDENRHIDYGYAVTSYSAQGQTVNRVLAEIDTRAPDVVVNRRTAYVMASRARAEVTIYTDSAERLGAALARQVDKSTALEAVRGRPEATPQLREVPDGQEGRTQAEAGADRARGDGEAGATAREGRRLSAFDRSRIHEPAARAVADARADSRNSPRRDRAGVEDGARGAAGRERGREGADRSAVRRAEPGADGHERAREQPEGRHAQQPGPDGARDRGTQVAAERPRAAAGARAAERHAAPDAQAHDVAAPAHVPAAHSAGRAADAGRDARTNELPAPARVGREQAADARTDLRDGAAQSAGHGDLGVDNHRAPDVSHLGSLDVSRLGGAQPMDGRGAGRAGGHLLDLDRGGLRDLDDGIKNPFGLHSGVRGGDDSPGGVELHDLPVVGGAEAGHPHAGPLDRDGRPGIADKVRSILDRPAQVERMAAEMLRLADENRLAQGRPPVDAQVQEYMRAALVRAAERPPSEAQAERDRQIAEALGRDDPRHENALESSLYAARHAPHRGELLDRFTAAAESAYAREQAPAIEHAEPSHDFSISR